MISFYNNTIQTTNPKSFQIETFLDNIRTGLYEDDIHKLRTEKDEEKQKAIKKRLKCVTISGEFTTRNKAGLVKHSGFLAIDIDGRNPNEVKQLIKGDEYVYSMFTSCRGNGLCVLVKINPEKHTESFQTLCEYFYTTYNIIVDSTGSDVSRLRYVSFDPDIVVSKGSKKWTKVKEYKEPKRVTKTIFVKTDFDEVIRDIQVRGVNLCDNYHEWVRIGFAFADHFGEGGREYFHLVSGVSSKYKTENTDKQYNICLKRNGGATVATMGTFYHYCKDAGVRTYSERTKRIVNSVISQRKGGVLKESEIIENLEVAGFDDANDIVKQIVEKDLKETIDSNLIDDIEAYLRSKYDMKRNVLTRFIENRGEVVTEVKLNSIFLDVKKQFDKSNKELLEIIINSECTKDYNPIEEYINQNIDRGETGSIDRLLNCIKTDDPEYLLRFGKKWLVSMFAGLHGSHSPLMLSLIGKTTGTGKTTFFRTLLPVELRRYYAESKLDRPNDDPILMCQKLIIMDDEMSGKSKKDSAKMRDLTSKDYFDLREPYGKSNVTLKRLALLCGTTNLEEVIVDEGDNRRIIPIRVISIDWVEMAKIDRCDVFMEAYKLFQDGFEWEILGAEKEYLNADKEDFVQHTEEYEMVSLYFKVPKEFDAVDYKTATEIKAYIEQRSGVRVNSSNIGKALAKMGFEKVEKKLDGVKRKVYKTKLSDTVYGQN